MSSRSIAWRAPAISAGGCSGKARSPQRPRSRKPAKHTLPGSVAESAWGPPSPRPSRPSRCALQTDALRLRSGLRCRLGSRGRRADRSFPRGSPPPIPTPQSPTPSLQSRLPRRSPSTSSGRRRESRLSPSAASADGQLLRALMNADQDEAIGFLATPGLPRW